MYILEDGGRYKAAEEGKESYKTIAEINHHAQRVATVAFTLLHKSRQPFYPLSFPS